jgi:hypothetical protein
MKGELPLESALLFKVPEQLSPRLAWKRKFNISTQDHGYHPESEFERWPMRKIGLIYGFLRVRSEARLKVDMSNPKVQSAKTALIHVMRDSSKVITDHREK